MRIEYAESREKPRRYHAVKCLDCKRILGSKQEAAKSHRGHDVRYVDKNGEVDE